MTTTVEKLKERGFWHIVIRPSEFDAKRVGRLADLETAVRECAVLLRGWDFPHYDERHPCARGLDWAGQETDWNHHVEMWRAYKSGQFVAMFAMWGDWRDQSKLWPPHADWSAGGTLSVEDAVYSFTEIFEFAARYSNTVAGTEKMLIRIELRGLSNRQLVLAPTKAGFEYRRIAEQNEWKWEERFVRSDLRARARELALKPAVELFEQFRWDVKEDTLRSIQDHLKKQS